MQEAEGATPSAAARRGGREQESALEIEYNPWTGEKL
jgi:hypothetical protein